MSGFAVLPPAGTLSCSSVTDVRTAAMGVKIKDVYWTLGHYDIVITLEASNDEIVESLMMKVGSMGQIKTQALRAFGESEIEAILSKVK